MLAKFKDYAEKLAHDWDVLPIYEDLVSYFQEEKLFREYAGLIEKKYNITKDPELLLAITDVLTNKLFNYDTAMLTSLVYLKKLNPSFYNNFMKIANEKNIDSILSVKYPDEDFPQLIDLLDRYTTIIYMMVYFAKKDDYSPIDELYPYLIVLRDKIVKFAGDNSCRKHPLLTDMRDANRHIATLLSEKNDINMNLMSIKICPTIEKAYLNVILEYILKDNYDEALKFYNSSLPRLKSANKIDSIVDLFWFISDKFSRYGEFFKSIVLQKKAIEYELNK